MERNVRKWLWPNLKYYNGIFLELLAKTAKNLVSQLRFKSSVFPETSQTNNHFIQPTCLVVTQFLLHNFQTPHQNLQAEQE